MTMKSILIFMITFILILSTSCRNDKSFYLKNKSHQNIEIIYDSRVYTSRLDTSLILGKKNLQPDSIFFLGPRTDISNIWPAYLQINSLKDTIILIGQKSIKSMINGETWNNQYILIY